MINVTISKKKQKVEKEFIFGREIDKKQHLQFQRKIS